MSVFMDLEIFGDSHSGYSAHFECDGTLLNRCPFCGNTDPAHMTVSNSHTPCYSVECECGAEMHGESSSTAGPVRTVRTLRKQHKEAFISCVSKWNRRARGGLV